MKVRLAHYYNGFDVEDDTGNISITMDWTEAAADDQVTLNYLNVSGDGAERVGLTGLAVIPEPGSLALLLFGAALLFTGRRRCRRAVK